MKLITFSLWGNNPLYCKGAISNSRIAKEIYPDWKCRFYVGQEIPSDLIKELLQNEAEVIVMESLGKYHGAFWRFLAMDSPDLEMMISRDCDSRLNSREASAVAEWLKSGKLFHAMHDNPAHTTPILAGMWGSKKLLNFEMEKTIKEFNNYTYHGCDQDFLTKSVYPIIKDNCLRHVSNCPHAYSYGGTCFPFPEHTPIKYGTFVGEIISANAI